MKITLAEAFMMRNDLKKEIVKLTEAADQNLWNETSLPIDFTKGNKKHPKDAMKEALERMDILQQLNEKITAVNLTNNKILRENETVIAKIAFLESVFLSLKRYPGDKTRNPYFSKEVDGSTQFFENTLLVDPIQVSTLLEELKARKRAVEKELYHNNFTLAFEI